MTPATTELARRAVAAEAFRWMPGMRLQSGFRVVAVDPDGVPICAEESDRGRRPHRREKGLLLDTDDPATRGCLLELVRERVGTDRVYCEVFLSFLPFVPVTWACIALGTIWNGPEAETEAGALVAALEHVSREDGA